MEHGAERKDSIGSYVHGDQRSTRYRAGSVFRMPRARLIARWPRFIGRGERTTETVFRRSFFAPVIARYRLLIARYSRPTVHRFGERSRDENARKRSMWRPTRSKYFVAEVDNRLGLAESRQDSIEWIEIGRHGGEHALFVVLYFFFLRAIFEKKKKKNCAESRVKNSLARWSFVNNETRFKIEALRRVELWENEVGKPQCISTPARAHIWVAINGFGRGGCLSVDKSFHLVSLSRCLHRSLLLITFLLVPRVFLPLRSSSHSSLSRPFPFRIPLPPLLPPSSSVRKFTNAKLGANVSCRLYQDFHSW